MKKFAVLGSCLSAQLAMRLKRAGFEHVGSLHHIRSDALNSYIADPRTFGLPPAAVASVQGRLEALSGKKAAALQLRVGNQSRRKMDNFLTQLAAADFLIVDNQYDTRRQLYRAQIDGSSFIVSNTKLDAAGIESEGLGLMDVKLARQVYSTLFVNLRAVNPGLQIIFIHYPISGRLSAQGYADPVVRRSRAVSKSIDDPAVSVLPLMNVTDAANLAEANPNHFTESVYDLYAEAVAQIAGGRPFPGSPGSEILLEDLAHFCSPGKVAERAPAPALGDNPYQTLPERQFWKKAVGDRYPLAIDQLYDGKYEISTQDAVATCGSCFAQHIGRRLRANGFNYMDVEKAPETMPARERTANGYGIYSARYGNVYTSSQLLQLLERALGKRSFDEAWELPQQPGEPMRYVDPFRPNLTPDGYASVAEMLQAQAGHLEAVRGMFTSLDVFIFTMGLTEHWVNRKTGAAYPISPGVSAGRFDPDTHAFRNLTYEETMKDMLSFIDLLKSVNPGFRMLLTVSPVPLTATAERRHVLLSTMHSKSILRAVAGELARRFDFVDYFPSYEIVMSPPFRGMFFQNNMRTVHEQGVDFVMSHFFSQHRPDATDRLEAEGDNELLCDEVLLEAERSAN